ncbi:flagellin N-terminal helical domain-containing protein [Thiorhodovibrio litoralis]|uniref:flagellin N-terminal helical domain-containing protein n=1 Tax=Thiorhodovibrio litoralis TaxID=2952932 RepID=UPI003899BDA2
MSERFTSQTRGLDQAIRNANGGISLTQVRGSALSTGSDELQRILKLAIKASNDTL